jgi:hypothetical protein
MATLSYPSNACYVVDSSVLDNENGDVYFRRTRHEKLVHFHSQNLCLLLPKHLLPSRLLTKILYVFSAPPSLLYVPPITPYLITQIFYKNKNYDSPHVSFHVLMSIYSSAVQLISSIFSSQTLATNIHWFKLRLMS